MTTRPAVPSPNVIARRVAAAARAMGLESGSYKLHVESGGAFTLTPLTIDAAAELSAANEDWIDGVGDVGGRNRNKKGKAHAP